jgi:hypothetical protein
MSHILILLDATSGSRAVFVHGAFCAGRARTGGDGTAQGLAWGAYQVSRYALRRKLLTKREAPSPTALPARTSGSRDPLPAGHVGQMLTPKNAQVSLVARAGVCYGESGSTSSTLRGPRARATGFLWEDAVAAAGRPPWARPPLVRKQPHPCQLPWVGSPPRQGACMPRHAAGNVAYRRMTSNHLCLHAGPPVCHVCQQTMTRHHGGGMFWEGLPGG